MFKDFAQKITTEQIAMLEQRGVARARVSEWRKGKGVPSRKAVLTLAEVMGLNPLEIEREVMLDEAGPEQAPLFQRALRSAPLYIMSTRRKLSDWLKSSLQRFAPMQSGC